MGLVVISIMVGCGGAKNSVPAKNVVKGQTLHISSKAKYEGDIAENILKECTIDTQVMKYIKAYSAKQGFNVVVDGKPKANENVLKVSITDAVSSRSGYRGHNKYVTISGKLYKGNKLEASFKGARKSGGGMFGAYKGSCAVLNGCTKTIGRDTARWLSDPKNNAKLGDAYLIK